MLTAGSRFTIPRGRSTLCGIGPGEIMKIEALVILGMGGLVLGRILVWLMEAARTPDPWGAEIQAALDEPDAVPLCPHCLTLQEHNGWFCPECGSTVGQYSNYLPTVYMFSIGEALRAGVQQRNRWTPLVTAGYILVAFAELSLLAPFYCLFLFMNRAKAAGPGHEAATGDFEI